MFIANVLQPLIDACQWVLEFWHGVIGDGPNSWGWSIILLTFTVRILILPLTFKGVKGMQRLQVLQPEIKKIQARFKDDKQRQQQEIMAFYQREKVNPLELLPAAAAADPLLHLALLPAALGRVPGGHREQPGLLPDRRPRREGQRGPRAAGLADRPLRRDAARRQRRHRVQRGSDAAPHHVCAAVRLRHLHHQLRGGPDPLLDHHQRVDGRSAAARQEALPEAGARGRGRGRDGGLDARARETAEHGHGRLRRRQRQGRRRTARTARTGKDAAKPAAKAGASASGSSGGARTKAPPASPRKKKKRSGRRR